MCGQLAHVFGAGGGAFFMGLILSPQLQLWVAVVLAIHGATAAVAVGQQAQNAYKLVG